MIAKMKKVTLALLRAAVQESLETLMQLGIVHIQTVQAPQSEGLEALREESDLLERALAVLASRKGEAAPRQTPSAVDTAKETLAMVDRRQEWEERLQSLQKEVERMRPLGDFSPADLSTLQQNGVFAKLYECATHDLEQAEIEVPYAVVGREGDKSYVIAVAREDFSLPLSEMTIPDRGLGELQREMQHLEAGIEDLNRRLDLQGVYAAFLQDALFLHQEKVAFAEVAAGLGREGMIAYVQGYCPSDDVERLQGKAREVSWGVMVEEPSESDDVPTLIKNPRWLRIVEPLFSFMGTVPGYREFDVSFWFLISLALFFAMLVGDGGYGCLFFMVTFLARRKFKSAGGEPFYLLYLFSGATIVWGAVTGTWFGVEGFSQLPILKRLIVTQLNSYADNEDFMLHLCFVLGAVHLTIAHLWRGVRTLNSPRAISEVGWICILWFLYFLAGHLVLGRPLPDFGFPLLGAGVIFVALFSNPQRNFLKSSLLGFAYMPLKVMSSFSDLVSYLRLFAVGYATLVVAVSFNEMALSIGGHPLIRGAVAVLILLLGHTLNILLAAMAVLVHGVRLNMLEFSSHLGMGWTGRPYRPFKRKIRNPNIEIRNKFESQTSQ